MTLSSEVLPAPLGPMMARISPLRMSNETSRIAFTPPNASETFSTASSTCPASTSPDGALTYPSPERGGSAAEGRRGGVRASPPPDNPLASSRIVDLPPPGGGRERAWPPRRTSRGLLHGSRHRRDLHVADLQPRGHRALAAVLEGDLGRDRGFACALVERLDQ